MRVYSSVIHDTITNTIVNVYGIIAAFNSEREVFITNIDHY